MPRLVVVSLVSTLILAALRAFKANYHLRVTYKHRALVLETFDLLIRSADSATKEIMLRSVADVIFKADQTGFIGDDEPRVEQQALALFREMNAAKKGES